MNGLKNVRQRRDDALAKVGWEQLEALLAEHYRGQGFRVEHVGTAGTGARFDGGIDLKLHREDEYILVQCKHWNAKQVPHNAVHELLGLLVNEGATGAILVSSGEFTRAAIDAATRQGHVQLIDGDALRLMLGARLDRLDASQFTVRTTANGHGRRGRVNRASQRAANAIWWLFSLLGMLVFLWLIQTLLQRTAGTAGPAAQRMEREPGPIPPARGEDDRPMDSVTWHGEVLPEQKQATDAEIREARRRAEESQRIIEQSTPEM
ncbi:MULTISPECIES: restriction endonuclease [Lysobacter]|uniref:restriction endonuclease n=1 Tax=Lysobacter TaxID=68 RepID=UPI00068D94CA|nr:MULTISPECIES: restriction endonuclease [Lysobacter]